MLGTSQLCVIIGTLTGLLVYVLMGGDRFIFASLIFLIVSIISLLLIKATQ